MYQEKVAIALSILLEELDTAINMLNQEGAQEFQAGKYEIARNLIDRGTRMKAFYDKVEILQGEWNQLFSPEAGKLPIANITSEVRKYRTVRQIRSTNIPQGLSDVLDVSTEMLSGKSYREAIRVVAERRKLKSEHTIEDACTRRISTPQTKVSATRFKQFIQYPNRLRDHLN